MTTRVDLQNGVAVFATAVFDDHDKEIFMDISHSPSVNLRVVMSCAEAAALRDALTGELKKVLGDDGRVEL